MISRHHFVIERQKRFKANFSIISIQSIHLNLSQTTTYCVFWGPPFGPAHQQDWPSAKQPACPAHLGSCQAQGSCGPGSLDLIDQLQSPVYGLGFRKGGPASALDSGLPTLGGRRCTSCPGSGCHQLAGSRPRPGSAFGQVTLFYAASRQGQGSRAVHTSPQFPNLQGLVFLWGQGLTMEGIPGCVQDHPCRGPASRVITKGCGPLDDSSVPLRGHCPCPCGETAQRIGHR